MSAIFFFQAEDGIRDLTVTGVQTCALPIFEGDRALQVVTRNGLVERERLEIGPCLVAGVIGAQEVDPGATAVLGRRIPFAHALALAKCRIGFDYDVGPGKASERGGRRGPGPAPR